MARQFLGAVLLTLAACASIVGSSPVDASAPSTKAALEALLATDKKLGESAKSHDVVDGLAPLFADDVAMPVPGKGFVDGKAAVLEALKANPDNAKGHLSWTPARGVVSADGQHGFTFGYMTLHRDGAEAVPLKYLAYWVHGPSGWRVAVYKRGKRPAGDISAPLPASLAPEKSVATADASQLETYRESLDAIERAFSDEAQKIGLGPAFVKYGSDDAINLGGPKNATFVVGAQEIGKLVGEGLPPNTSPVTWAPDRVIVSGSGDLGVTIGYLKPNQAAPDGNRQPIPFFTIWRRADSASPWRYIAE
ncbi:hypothetical protein [Tahibacter amnicola]|uniref:Ketosteroid isomerase-like protein n=1 Tax=Tahibacter amnicola TaxID=2976241 RepID=A0ABY6BHS8_9GAMM|nr:hypothetical protein [Tahibacter amnicola]UXI69434.1 hypothetical protein N4264_07235 [Tahibacter amnicola]